MLKLFDVTDTLFSSNGDKVIKPLRAIVHKEDNGSFHLDLETDLSYVNDFAEGKIIVAPTPQGDQPFRINNLTKTKFNIDLQKEVLTTTNNTNLTKNMDTFNNIKKPNNDMITLIL